MVGVPALRPETFSRSFPKDHRAQIRKTETIKYIDEVDALGRRRGAWTVAFWRWVRGLRPAEPAAAAAFDHYVACARCAESDKRALERRVAEVAATERWRPAVEALSCIKGVDVATAFCLAAEAGVFSRFRSAGAYASWLGLTPSEHSSGETEARGGITKAGNSASRRALVEAAWHFASCSPRPKQAPRGSSVPPATKRRCDEATARLCARHEALRAAGKRPCVANVAVVFSQVLLSEKSEPFFRVSSRKFFGFRRGHAASFLTCPA